jgi:hypothetical protein
VTSSGPTTYSVRQVFYTGLGAAGAVFCTAGAVFFWGSWTTYFLLLYAVGCVAYIVWNAGLAYVLDAGGVSKQTRWKTRRLAHWTEISKMKYFDRDMTLILQRRDGTRITIRCGELAEPEVFAQEVLEHEASPK